MGGPNIWLAETLLAERGEEKNKKKTKTEQSVSA